MNHSGSKHINVFSRHMKAKLRASQIPIDARAASNGIRGGKVHLQGGLTYVLYPPLLLLIAAQVCPRIIK